MQVPIPEVDCAFSWLKVFITDDLIEHITLETNWYAWQYLESHTLSPGSRDNNFKEIQVFEVWNFIGLMFMKGID